MKNISDAANEARATIWGLCYGNLVENKDRRFRWAVDTTPLDYFLCIEELPVFLSQKSGMRRHMISASVCRFAKSCGLAQSRPSGHLSPPQMESEQEENPAVGMDR